MSSRRYAHPKNGIGAVGCIRDVTTSIIDRKDWHKVVQGAYIRYGVIAFISLLVLA